MADKHWRRWPDATVPSPLKRRHSRSWGCKEDPVCDGTCHGGLHIDRGNWELGPTRAVRDAARAELRRIASARKTHYSREETCRIFLLVGVMGGTGRDPAD